MQISLICNLRLGLHNREAWRSDVLCDGLVCCFARSLLHQSYDFLATMSDVRDYLLKVDSDKFGAEEIAHQTARSEPIESDPFSASKTKQCAELESKQTSLIEVVQSLGKYINDEDHAIRAKAVQYLSSVIGATPSNFLTIQQVQVLCQFLCDRIEDGGAVGGLRKLSSLRKFTKDMAKMTTRA